MSKTNAETSPVITGSCLCGEVRYEISGQLQHADHCHCSQCRRQHGAAFATYADFSQADFRWVSGEQQTTVYSNDAAAGWCFCQRCGSTLGGTENGVLTSVTLGTVTSDAGITASAHIFVGSKADWYVIEDSLPQFKERPD